MERQTEMPSTLLCMPRAKPREIIPIASVRRDAGSTVSPTNFRTAAQKISLSVCGPESRFPQVVAATLQKTATLDTVFIM